MIGRVLLCVDGLIGAPVLRRRQRADRRSPERGSGRDVPRAAPGRGRALVFGWPPARLFATARGGARCAVQGVQDCAGRGSTVLCN